MRSYENFDLHITRSRGHFVARVQSSPAGQATTEFELPFSPDAIENFVLHLLGPDARVRSLGGASRDRARDFGSELHHSLFTGEVQTSFRRSVDAVSREGKGLRLRLHVDDDPDLNRIPWEFLYSQGLGRFVGLSNLTPIVRYVDVGVSPLELRTRPPIRILTVLSEPSDVPPLQVRREAALLQEATADLVRRGALEVHRLPAATLPVLQQQLRRNAFHILHFLGHGYFDERLGEGQLVFEDDEGRARMVSGADLGMMVHDHSSLRMVVLNSCDGARVQAGRTLGGVAQSLMRQGMPAVVAMQFPVSDDAALIFSHELYEAIADGYPVDAAVSEARKSIYAETGGVEWATPVLHLRAQDGRLFDIVGEAAPSEVDHLLELAQREVDRNDADALVTATGMLERALVLDPSNSQTRARLEELRREDEELLFSGSQARPPGEDVPSRQPRPAVGVDDDVDEAEPSSPGSPESPTPDRSPPSIPARVARRSQGSVARPRRKRGLPTLALVLAAAGVVLLGMLTWNRWLAPDAWLHDVPPDSTVAFSAPAHGINRNGLDGDLQEWSQLDPWDINLFTRSYAGTLSATGTWVKLSWGERRLFFAAQVSDPDIGPGAPWPDDRVYLHVSKNLNLVDGRAEGDVAINLAPDAQARGQHPALKRVGVWRDSAWSSSAQRGGLIQATGRVDPAGGYVLEAMIPWEVLGSADRPDPGDVWALMVEITSSDDEVDDDRGILTSKASPGKGRPACWGRVLFWEDRNDEPSPETKDLLTTRPDECASPSGTATIGSSEASSDPRSEAHGQSDPGV